MPPRLGCSFFSAHVLNSSYSKGEAVKSFKQNTESLFQVEFDKKPNSVIGILYWGRKQMPKKKFNIDSIDLETLWLPFLNATNGILETDIPHEAINTPIELALDPDGKPKFRRNGRLLTKLNKQVDNNIKLVKRNFKNYYTELSIEDFIRSLTSEINLAITKKDLNPELTQKIRRLFQHPSKKGHIQIVPGSFEMGKHR